MTKSRKKRKAPKRVLALPDREQAKSAVLTTLTSKSGQRTYDHAIMEFVEGPVSFVDTRNNTRPGKAYLKPVQTVTAGVPFGRPYSSPFSVR